MDSEGAAQFGFDNGWFAAAPAWVEGMGDEGDAARAIVLDPVMLTLAGDVSGKRVLDLGCGEGRFCRMLTARDAATVGLDLIRDMVVAARERDPGSGLYVQGSGDVLPFGEAAFDLVVSYLTLIDITDFRSAIEESARVLRPGGHLLVANLSAFITASDGWERDTDGRRLYKRVDRYLETHGVVLEGNGMRFLNWHRPLDAYMEAFLNAGLILRRFLEPTPADQSLRDDPRFEGDFRVPDFVVMLCCEVQSPQGLLRPTESGNARRIFRGIDAGAPRVRVHLSL